MTRSLSQIDLESSIEFDAIKTCTSNSSTDLLDVVANSRSSSNEDIPTSNIRVCFFYNSETDDKP